MATAIARPKAHSGVGSGLSVGDCSIGPEIEVASCEDTEEAAVVGELQLQRQPP